jgi:single-stranded-DNA-specific exonuclease
VKTRLVNYANSTLSVDLLKPLVTIDAQASLADIGQTLYNQIDYLHPCGIENPDPVFWTPNVQVVEQQVVGRNRNHLKLVLAEPGSNTTIKAIAWRWGEYYPLPDRVNIAYKLKQNDWQGNRTIELELVGVQPPDVVPARVPAQTPVTATETTPLSAPPASPPSPAEATPRADPDDQHQFPVETR